MKIIFYLLIISGFMMSCSRSSIRHLASEEVQITAEHQSFGILQTSHTVKGDKYIREVIIKEFARRGLVYDPENPDLLVSYQLVKEKVPFISMVKDIGLVNRKYKANGETLILQTTDMKTYQMLWRGLAKDIPANSPSHSFKYYTYLALNR